MPGQVHHDVQRGYRSPPAAEALRTTCAVLPDSPPGGGGSAADTAQVVLRVSGRPGRRDLPSGGAAEDGPRV